MFIPFNFPEEIIYIYTNSDCDVLADTLHERLPESELYYVVQRLEIEYLIHTIIYLPDKKIFVDVSGIFTTPQDVIQWWESQYHATIPNIFHLLKEDAYYKKKREEEFGAACPNQPLNVIRKINDLVSDIVSKIDNYPRSQTYRL